MPRYSLRSLLILIVVGPPLLAAALIGAKKVREAVVRMQCENGPPRRWTPGKFVK
jgi:hypothetical protein